jgi:hypothetical protein
MGDDLVERDAPGVSFVQMGRIGTSGHNGEQLEAESSTFNSSNIRFSIGFMDFHSGQLTRRWTCGAERQFRGRQPRGASFSMPLTTASGPMQPTNASDPK